MTTTPGRRSADPADEDIHPDLRRILAQFDRLPANPPVALRLLAAVSDPRHDAAGLAGVAEPDPALTGQLLRMANSAFVAPASPVTTVRRAVVLLGEQAVTAVAVLAAAGLAGSERVPGGFWEHAACVGAATATVAPVYGLPRNEGFTLGVLHDLGVAVLRLADSRGFARVEGLVAAGEAPALADWLVFGTTRGEVSARLLRSWGLPHSWGEALRFCHGSGDAATGLPEERPARALRVADALVHAIGGAPPYDLRQGDAEAVADEPLPDGVRHRIAALVAS